jgi:hypothetical protein
MMKSQIKRPEEHCWYATDVCSLDWHRDHQPPMDGTRFLGWYPDDQVQILRWGLLNEANVPYSKPLYWRPLPK